jgi:hypothetical protein
MVQTVDGGLFSVSGQEVRPIGAGQRIERSQIVRTGNSSGAILVLVDGSRVEMNSRSELFFDRGSDGVRINLNRGDIIVTAAKQHGGHLYVGTKDLGVTVVGTLFEVSSGVKGSRVAVLEGQVRVSQGGQERSLTPGQQLASDPGMPVVAAKDQISWSHEVSKYLQLLQSTQAIQQQLANLPERHTSDLVPLVPADTVVFASLPNISQSIAQSYALFKQRMAESGQLESWWLQNGGPATGGVTIDQIVQQLTQVGGDLGPEVIFAFPQNLGKEGPVILADVTSPSQLASAFAGSNVRVVTGVAQLQSLQSFDGLIAFIGQGVMIVSTDPSQVLRCIGYLQQPGSNPFAGTSLYARLAQAYTNGVGWIIAADFQNLGNGAGDLGLQQTGLADIQQFVAEQKTSGDGGSYKATLAFNQVRRGMASWLAQPSPMGSLDFVSPAAYGVAAVVTKDPSSMFDDVMGFISSGGDTHELKDLQNYEAEHRVDIRHDFVAPLGNEMLFAIDGPVLPTPAWKVVIEVNNAARLQNTIEWSIGDSNRAAADHQQPQMTLTSETSGGRIFYSVTGTSFPTEIHYTYWAGYMVLAPTRAMLMEAIQNHDTGNSLLRSAAFRSQLPADGYDYASGVVYQNIQAMAGSLPVDVTKQANLNAIPSLVAIYGGPDNITMSSKGVLGMNIASVMGISGMVNMTGLREQRFK